MRTKNSKRVTSVLVCILMMTVTILGLTGSAVADEGWPTLNHDVARTSYTTGLVPVEGPTSYRWTTHVTNEHSNMYRSVVVVDGYVYAFIISETESGIKRFNYMSGVADEDWFIPLNLILNRAAITVDNSRIYFHDRSMTYCYDIETQEKIWEFNGFNYSTSFMMYGPTVAFNKVYCVNQEGIVFCLDGATGTLEWNTVDDLSTPDPLAIDVDNDKLFVVSGDDLYCYEATPDGVDDGYDDPDGVGYDILWIYNDGIFACSPIVSNGFVFIGYFNTVFCFNGDDGSNLWNTSIIDFELRALATAHGYLYAINRNYAYCLNTTTGAIEWETQVNSNDNLLGSLALAGDILVIGTNTGWIYCLDTKTGDTLWTHHENTIDIHFSPLAIYEGWIYVVSKNGDLCCFGGDTHYPETPDELRGPNRGQVGLKYWFSTDNVDDLDEKDNLYYLFDWGDGTDSGWVGPYEAGEDVEVHSWHRWNEPGDYTVKVKARDDLYETNWSGKEKNIHIDFLEINSITGGFGVSAQIKNMANLSKDVDWTIQVAGGYFGFHVLKQDSNGILSLGPEETATITTDGMLFGLGPIEIKIEAEIAGESITELQAAFLLGFYISV